MGIFDKVKETADKAKEATKKYAELHPYNR